MLMMIIMIMMIMMIMMIVSVEQRPGWGEHVVTIVGYCTFATSGGVSNLRVGHICLTLLGDDSVNTFADTVVKHSFERGTLVSQPNTAPPTKNNTKGSPNAIKLTLEVGLQQHNLRLEHETIAKPPQKTNWGNKTRDSKTKLSDNMF